MSDDPGKSPTGDREREILALKSRLKRWGPEEIEAGLRELQHRKHAHGRLARTIAQVQSRLGLWGPREVALGLDEFRVRRREQQRQRRALTVTATLAACAAAAILVVSGVRRARHDAAAPNQPIAALEPAKNADSEAKDVLTLDEGSDVTLLGDDTEATVTERKADRISVNLRSGSARFRVKHSTDRLVAVFVGGVRIEDLGTTFLVERRADEVLVSVSEGSVRVSWDGQTAELAAGSHGAYPVSGEADLRGIPEASSPKRATAGESWRAAARDGRYDRAWSLLSLEGPAGIKDDPTDLLLAADVARLSGHPAEAVSSLRAVVRKHRRDPRAQSAAFMLGLVLMKNLGRPRDAAQAFADVERLAPSGNLAEDAVAREAEAWLAAGERERAETERSRYASMYPHGRHLAFLRHLFDAP